MRLGLIALLLIATAACGSEGSSAAVEPAPTVTVTEFVEVLVTPTPKPKPKPQGPPRVLPGDGMYKVGEDVAAGTYRNAGGRLDGAPCVVFTSREPGDLQSHVRGSTSEGPATIELRAGEWWTTQYCEDFKKVG